MMIEATGFRGDILKYLIIDRFTSELKIKMNVPCFIFSKTMVLNIMSHCYNQILDSCFMINQQKKELPDE